MLSRLRLRVFTDWNDYEMKLLGACVAAFCVIFYLMLSEQVSRLRKYGGLVFTQSLHTGFSEKYRS